MYKPPNKGGVQNDPGPSQSVVSLIQNQKPPAPSCSSPYSQDQSSVNRLTKKKGNRTKQLGIKMISKSTGVGVLQPGVIKPGVRKPGVIKPRMLKPGVVKTHERKTEVIKTGVVTSSKPDNKLDIPPKPVRPPSAFLCFISKNVPIHAEKGNTDAISKASQAWRALTQGERDKHELEYQKANEKFKADVIEYNKRVEQSEGIRQSEEMKQAEEIKQAGEMKERISGGEMKKKKPSEEMKKKKPSEGKKKKKPSEEMKKKKPSEVMKKKKQTPLYIIPTNKYIKTKESCEVGTIVQSENIEQIDTQEESNLIMEEVNATNHYVVENNDTGIETIEHVDRIPEEIEDGVESTDNIKETAAREEGGDCKDKNKPFSCKCGKAFSSIYWYQTHAKKCKAQFNCDKCPKTFKNLKCLKKHNKLVHIQGKVCTVCDALFSTDKVLNNHMKRTHADTVPCPKCKTMYKNEKSMKKHLKHFCEKNNDKVQMKKKTVKETCKCAICPKTFNSSRGLRAHKAKYHRNKNSDLINSINKFALEVKDTENESFSSDDYVFEDEEPTEADV